MTRRLTILAVTSAVIAAATIFLLSSTSAPSQAANDRHCHKNDSLTVYRVNDNAYQSAAYDALNDWRPGTPLNFTSSGTLKLIIGATNYESNGDNGYTNATCPPGSNIQNNPSASFWNTYYMDSATSNAKRATMVHEISHSMGLGDVSSPSDCAHIAVMYYSDRPFVTCGIIKPQADDKGGINGIY